MGENCSSGCPTRSHATFAECMKAKRIGHMHLGGTTDSNRTQRAFDRQTAEYTDLVRAGGSMAVAERKGIDAAWAQTEGR